MTRRARSPLPEVESVPSTTTATVPPARKRVLVVDDHPMMRSGLAQLINSQPDLTLCGEAGTPAEALEMLRSRDTDLLLTDLTLPGGGGLEFIHEVRARWPELPILVISMHDEMVFAEGVLRAGARGYIMKEAGAEKLLAAIHRVAFEGQIHISEPLSARLLDVMARGRSPEALGVIERLSSRELEVFRHIGQGLSTQEIARELRLSPKTIDVHRAHIKMKLELKTAVALVRQAVRWVESQHQ